MLGEVVAGSDVLGVDVVEGGDVLGEPHAERPSEVAAIVIARRPGESDRGVERDRPLPTAVELAAFCSSARNRDSRHSAAADRLIRACGIGVDLRASRSIGAEELHRTIGNS